MLSKNYQSNSEITLQINATFTYIEESMELAKAIDEKTKQFEGCS